MPALIFENPGEINHRLITTIGLNVKEGPNPFGFFGSGLKYAIAIVLRLRGSISIQSGLQCYNFHIKPDTVRGKDFDFIRMTYPDGHEETLGFTTDFGKTWEPWMAYRELYCNSIDENGPGTPQLRLRIPSGEPGITRIIVTNCPDMVDAHENRHRWLLTQEPLYATPMLAIHSSSANGTNNYFYRGVLVGKLSRPALYTYNVLAPLKLSEDRTVPQWAFELAFEKAVLEDFTDTTALQNIITAKKDSFEYNMHWGSAGTPSAIFLQTLEKLFHNRRAHIMPEMIRCFRGRLPKVELPSVHLTHVQETMLHKAKNFLEKIGFELTAPIKIVETLGDQWTVGQAESGTIIISLSAFGKGTKFLASTLLEEHVHITLGLYDCSRELQDWLFDKVLSMGEELQGEPL